eukprot:scaffold48175_cov58-Cyclotella_meneghiniana.AAC.6
MVKVRPKIKPKVQVPRNLLSLEVRVVVIYWESPPRLKLMCAWEWRKLFYRRGGNVSFRDSDSIGTVKRCESETGLPSTHTIPQWQLLYIEISCHTAPCLALVVTVHEKTPPPANHNDSRFATISSLKIERAIAILPNLSQPRHM